MKRELSERLDQFEQQRRDARRVRKLGSFRKNPLLSSEPQSDLSERARNPLTLCFSSAAVGISKYRLTVSINLPLNQSSSPRP
jgi:hypothetical protein